MSHFKKAFQEQDRKALFASIKLLECAGPQCKEIIPELISLLSHKETFFQEHSAKILSNIGAEAVPPLIKLCEDDAQQLSLVLITLNGMYGEASAAVPFIKELLETTDETTAKTLSSELMTVRHLLSRVWRSTRNQVIREIVPAYNNKIHSTVLIRNDDRWSNEYPMVIATERIPKHTSPQIVRDIILGIRASGPTFISDTQAEALRGQMSDPMVALALFLAGDDSPECVDSLKFDYLVYHVIEFGWDKQGHIQRQLAKMSSRGSLFRAGREPRKSDVEWTYLSYQPEKANQYEPYANLIATHSADEFKLSPFFLAKPASHNDPIVRHPAFVKTNSEFWLEEDLSLTHEREESPRPFASWDSDLLPAINRTIERNGLEDRATVIDSRLLDLAKTHWLITGTPVGFNIVHDMATDVMKHRNIPQEYLSYNGQSGKSDISERYQQLLVDLEHFPNAQTIDTSELWKVAFAFSANHVETARNLWQARPSKETATLIFDQLGAKSGMLFDRQRSAFIFSKDVNPELWGLFYQMKEYLPQIHNCLRTFESEFPGAATRDEARRALLSTGGIAK